MNIEQIILHPITTSEFADPEESRRFIHDDSFYGYDYVFLEDATWHALCHIAVDQGCTVDDLCSHIDLNFAGDEPFAVAARRYVLRYVADRIPTDIKLPPELRFLSELRGAQSIQ